VAHLQCIICGGDHEPHPMMCDDAGMDEQIVRLGARRWNRLTAQVHRAIWGEDVKRPTRTIPYKGDWR
jgi:hypothetical protein